MRALFLLLLLFVSPAFGEIKTDVEYLADDARQGRAFGSQGIKDARGYIAKALIAEGIQPFEQKVGNCANLIVTVKGSRPETYVVVGAHLDHMGVYRGRTNSPDGRTKWIQNGADDNASGSAMILELAKRVNRVKPIRTVVFVWFTGEETGFRGSKAFEKSRPAPAFMLNLDMVGHLKDDLGTWEAKPGELSYLFKKYPFASRITQRSSHVGSDQLTFNSLCPTIVLHTGLTDTYHTSMDDADTLDYEGMDKICDYAYDLILQVVGIQDYQLYNKRK